VNEIIYTQSKKRNQEYRPSSKSITENTQKWSKQKLHEGESSDQPTSIFGGITHTRSQHTIKKSGNDGNDNSDPNYIQ
jgi:hypothetical protein